MLIVIKLSAGIDALKPYIKLFIYVRNISHKTSGTLGFFGKTPISQKTITKLSTSADNAAVIAKVNELLDALGNISGYGLIDL